MPVGIAYRHLRRVLNNTAALALMRQRKNRAGKTGLGFFSGVARSFEGQASALITCSTSAACRLYCLKNRFGLLIYTA